MGPPSTAPTRFDQPPVPSNNNYASDPEVWDLIIVGAGVAGSALAYAQGKTGRRVLLLERELSQPDRIVGELLQPGGYLMLKRLGLADCVEGIDAQLVNGYALFKAGKAAVVKYPTEGFSADVAGRSFHHGRFVQKLRHAAAACPNVTVREGFVRRLLNGNGADWAEGEIVGGVSYKCTDGVTRSATADLTIVCDGMYSSFRKHFTDSKIALPSFFVGLILEDASLPHPNHGHVVLGKPSPILFYPISSTQVRVLVDVPGEKLPADLPAYLRQNVMWQVPEALRPAFERALARALEAGGGSIRSMQNKQMYAKPLHQVGALLLGDAFNMRHPLTGGGMTVALSDTKLLCDMLQPLPSFADAVATARRTGDFYTKRKPLSSTINTLANALYEVFCDRGSAHHERMRQACFDYLALGGMYSAGPISLLSGLNPRPSILVSHFFMVALFGCSRLLLPRPTLRGLWHTLLLLYSAAAIILPIIYKEGPTAVFLPWLAPKPYIQRSEAMRRIGSLTRVSSLNKLATKAQ